MCWKPATTQCIRSNWEACRLEQTRINQANVQIMGNCNCSVCSRIPRANLKAEDIASVWLYHGAIEMMPDPGPHFSSGYNTYTTVAGFLERLSARTVLYLAQQHFFVHALEGWCTHLSASRVLQLKSRKRICKVGREMQLLKRMQCYSRALPLL